MIVAPFAASSGWSLTCVEPDPTMARVLDRNLAAVAGLDYSIVASGLEDFADGLGPDPTGARRFGLLFAAQSWHWVSPERRALDAATVLVDSGTLALVWNVARPHPPDLQRALDEAYGGVMPPREWEPDATDRFDCTPRSARVEALSGRVRRGVRRRPRSLRAVRTSHYRLSALALEPSHRRVAVPSSDTLRPSDAC